MLGTGVTVAVGVGTLLVGIFFQRRLRGRPAPIPLQGSTGLVLAGLGITTPFVLLVWTDTVSVPGVNDSLVAFVCAMIAWLVVSAVFGVGRPPAD